MFTVVAVRRVFLTKHIRLRADEPIAGSETLISGAVHGLTASKAAYEFAEGFEFELDYPFWSRLTAGDKVKLRDVLAHPDVQHELFRKGKQPSQR